MSVPAILLMPEACEGFHHDLQVWLMPAPTTLSMPRGMWGEPYRKGVNGAHNTVGENVGAYNTAWVLLWWTSGLNNPNEI